MAKGWERGIQIIQKRRRQAENKRNSCNKICYGNNVKKYKLIKRKERVTAQS